MDGWFDQAKRILRTDGLLRLPRGARAESTLDRVVGRPPEESSPDDQGVDPALTLLTALAHALLSYGLPVHRLEEAVHRLNRALDLQTSLFVVPTGLVITVGTGPEQRTRVVRVVPSRIDLEALTALHHLVGRIERQEISPTDGVHRIEEIVGRPPRYPPSFEIWAHGTASVAAAALLGGNVYDLGLGALLGALVGLVTLLGRRVELVGRLSPAVCALVASALAIALEGAGAPVNSSILLLAALIVVVPGLTMTIGMLDLATAHLVSGTARIMGAVITFLQMGFGAALGHALAKPLPGDWVHLDPWPAPSWVVTFAPALAAVGLGIRTRVRPRDYGWVLLACSIAFLGSRGTAAFVGIEVAAFLGAFLLGVTSHAWARWQDRPSLVLLVPGTVMMVPGSLGFLGLSSFMESESAEAINTGFTVLMVATALSAGVLLATLALPPRRAL